MDRSPDPIDQWHGLTPRRGDEDVGPLLHGSHDSHDDRGGERGEEEASDDAAASAAAAASKGPAVPLRSADDVVDITAVAYARFQEKEKEKRARAKAKGKRSRKNADWKKRTRNRAAQEKLNKYMEKRR